MPPDAFYIRESFGKKKDWNSVVIWLMLAFLAVGPGMAGNLQPTRLVALIIFFYLVLKNKLFVPISLPSKRLVFTMFVWILWGIVSLIWTSDATNGINELIILIISFIVILVLLNLSSQASNVLSIIRFGWVSAFILTLPLAMWEFMTFQHLPDEGGFIPVSGGGIETGGPASTIMIYAGATFGNRNNYCAFIVLCFPFLLWSFEQAKKNTRKTIYLILLWLGVFIVVVNASRLGMGCIILELIFWLFLKKREEAFSLKKWLTIILITLIVYLAFTYQEHSLYRLQQLEEGLNGASQVGRTNLYINGLRLAKQTAGLGVGAGGFLKSVQTGSDMRSTGGIFVSHNLWIEVLVDYGAIVWSLFIFWLFSTFWYVVKVRRTAKLMKNDDVERALRYTIILMVAFPFCFMMNSSILRWTILWTIFASLAVICEIAWKMEKFYKD
jgi:teichuronic acid biosynthesis protein TuaE